MIRIGWDLDKTLEPRDGVGHYCHQLLKALMELDRENEYVLYSLHSRVGREELDGAFPHRPDNFRLAPEGSRSPDLTEVDVVHATTWVHPVAFPGPVLFTCYDLTFLSHPDCHTLENRLACLTGTLRAHLDGARFLAISQATAREMEDRLEIPAERIEVVYPAPADRFRPLRLQSADPPPTDRFGLPAEFILAVGTLEPRKNLARLIRAYDALTPEFRRRVSLVIAGGGGWKQESLPEATREIEGVRWLGTVADDELVLLYNRATVFAYPSLAEGFGLPIVEAMACGTPVVTSNVSSLAEVAADAAVTVDPLDESALASALRRVLADQDLRRELSTKGLARAGHFSWERTAGAVLELYRDLAGSGTLGR